MHSIKKRIPHQQSQTDKRIPAILEICQKMGAEKELAALLNLIAKEAARLMEADKASIFLFDRNKNELWSIITLDGTQIRFDARLGIAGAAALMGQTINVEDAYKDPRFYKGIDGRTGYRTKSLLVAPLRNQEGNVVGTFQVLNKKDGIFNKHDEEILELLGAQVAIAIETVQLVEELNRHREELLQENTQLLMAVEKRFSTQNILGTSPQIQNTVRLIEQISDSSVGVLITGESGTGKELVAKTIHYNSPRARSPFIALNCAALPESLVESELFGIEKGVATGVERRVGRFETATGGTLFLDEIGDLSPSAQAKILRVLQEGMIERVGGRKEIPVDVRVLAATNKNLESEIKDGNFRKDLYYRLKVIHIQMPALREIPEDIPLLANYFLSNCCREMDKEHKKLSPDALKCLMNYPWPGNIRELENKIKRLVVLTPRRVIIEDDLSEDIRNIDAAPLTARSFKETVKALERRLILEALQMCQQNQLQTAKALGLSRQGLIKKMKRYGIRVL